MPAIVGNSFPGMLAGKAKIDTHVLGRFQLTGFKTGKEKHRNTPPLLIEEIAGGFSGKNFVHLLLLLQEGAEK